MRLMRYSSPDLRGGKHESINKKKGGGAFLLYFYMFVYPSLNSKKEREKNMCMNKVGGDKI